MCNMIAVLAAAEAYAKEMAEVFQNHQGLDPSSQGLEVASQVAYLDHFVQAYVVEHCDMFSRPIVEWKYLERKTKLEYAAMLPSMIHEMIFSLEHSNEFDDEDYTDWTMRQGEQGVYSRGLG